MGDSNPSKQGGRQGGSGAPWHKEQTGSSNTGNSTSGQTSGTSSSRNGGVLAGFIIDCGQPKHAGMYITTIEEIVNYVQMNLTKGELVARTIITGTRVALKKPVKEKDSNNTDIEIWKAEIKDFVYRKKSYEGAMQRTYAIVWQQCTQNMRANMQLLPTFERVEEEADLIGLLEGIKSLVFNFEATKSLPGTLVCAMNQFYKFKQSKTIPDDEFLWKYKSMYDVIVQSGGKVGNHPGLIMSSSKKTKIDVLNDTQVSVHFDEAHLAAEEEFLACHFLRALNWECHGGLVTYLEN